MFQGHELDNECLSPSVWREWIEMFQGHELDKEHLSPSVWREWIEIPTFTQLVICVFVSLRVEGVD